MGKILNLLAETMKILNEVEQTWKNDIKKTLHKHSKFDWLVSPKCRIYAAMNRVSIGLDNGLVLNKRQAII